MKNLLLLFTIISITACTSSDNDTTETSTPPTTAETIIGNWTSQSTDAEGSFLNKLTFTEAGEMSIYISLTATGGTVVQESVEGKTWTLDGNQITTTDTLDDEVDIITVTVVNQDSIIIVNPEGDSITLTRDSDYDTTLIGVWNGVTVGESCTYTEQISFTSLTDFSAIITNMDCDDVVELVEGTYTNPSILSGTLLIIDAASSEELSAYYAVQRDKLTLLFEGSDEASFLDKQ